VTEDIQYVLEADPEQLNKIMKSQKNKPKNNNKQQQLEPEGLQVHN
jgi:hypothetical protein